MNRKRARRRRRREKQKRERINYGRMVKNGEKQLEQPRKDKLRAAGKNVNFSKFMMPEGAQIRLVPGTVRLLREHKVDEGFSFFDPAHLETLHGQQGEDTTGGGAPARGQEPGTNHGDGAIRDAQGDAERA